MRKVARFEKVSLEQFKKDFIKTMGETSEEKLVEIYNSIKLPHRATTGSAGYDFYSIVDFELEPNKTIMLPTGIRCFMENDVVLQVFPRSSLGFKYRFQLNNTVGIIDADYYNSDNEGHIFAKFTNRSNENKTISIKSGEAFMQGIFMEYLLTYDDETTGVRNGGFGSTNKK